MKKEETLKEKTARGLFWGGLSNGLQQLISLLFGIFLARLLTQDDYGMVGMLTVFSAIAAALQEGGFISALNKKKEATPEDYNAVFWFSFLCSLLLYSLLFLSAPLIARFYNEPQLEPLARYVFLGFVFTSLGIAPRAWLFRNLKTKEAAIVQFTALAVSGFVGILLAYNGYAYWGIATQSLVYVAMFTLGNTLCADWRPTLHVDFRPLKTMIGFSSRLIVTNLFTILNNNLFPVLFGRLYTKTDVGNYSQASKWTNMGSVLMTNMLWGVAQPVFAKVGDDRQRLLNILRKLLRFTAFFAFPAMFGLCLVSEELIVIAVTAKWLPSVPFMQLLCIGGAFVPVAALFSNLLISRGHSGVYMWCTIAQCLVQLAAVCLASPFGMMRMVQTFVAISILWVFVWWWFVRRDTGLSLSAMLLDVAPYLLLAAALCASAAYVCAPVGGTCLRLAAKIAYVGTLYALALWLSGSAIFRESVGFLLHKGQVSA